MILLVVTSVLLVSTGICGLWLRSNPSKKDESSVRFHMTIGLLSVVAGLLTMGSVAIFGW